MGTEAIKKVIADKMKEMEKYKQDVDEKRRYIRKYEDEMQKLQDEIDTLKRENFISEGSYVKVKEGRRKFLILEDVPKGLIGRVTASDELEGKVIIRDLKNGKEYKNVDTDNLIKVEDREYKKYLYLDVFKDNGREYLEYLEGDIVIHSKTGEVRIVKEFRYDDTVEACRYDIKVNRGWERGALYYGNWLPIYFREDMVGKGILDEIKDLKGIYI